MDMLDRYARRIDYLRISVTDRCNFRCQYCMPENGMHWFEREDVLTYEEITRVVSEVFIPLGLRKIRLTGGEPTLRRNLHKLVAMLRAIPEIADISLSTNASLLAAQGPALAAAGLDRVNISLDALDTERFKSISRGGDLSRVLAGIDAAVDLGLFPIKINCVVMPGENEAEIVPLAQMTVDRPLHVRFIEFMPVGDRKAYEDKGTFGLDEILALLERHFDMAPTEDRPAGNGPAKYWKIAGAEGTVGVIHPMSRHFCDTCNRFRLTSDGRVKSCLLVSSERDLKPALRAGASVEELQAIVFEALALKPEWHEMGKEIQVLTMSQIGG